MLILLLIIIRVIYTLFGEFSLEPTISTHSYLLKEVLPLQLNSYGHIWISASFVMINILLINHLIRSNQAFDENNYLGGFIYLVLSNSAQPFFQVTGSLIASTCLLLALTLILNHLKQRASEENIFFTGAVMGLAMLFYAPIILFLPLTLLIYVFYTRTLSRRYVLSTFGFCFPFIITYSISLYAQNEFELSFFFEGLFSNSITEFNAFALVFLILPALLLLTKLIGSFSGLKMTNHQIHFHRIMFLLFLSSVYLLFAEATDLGFIWVFAIPATYFICKSLLEIRKNWIRNTVFLLLLAQLVYPYLLAAYF